MQTVNLFIGGDHCPAANGKRFERNNPITGDLATSAAAATPEDATRAVDAAAAAFPRLVGNAARRTPSPASLPRRRRPRCRAADYAGDERGDWRDGCLGRFQRDAGQRHAGRGGQSDDL